MTWTEIALMCIASFLAGHFVGWRNGRGGQGKWTPSETGNGATVTWTVEASDLKPIVWEKPKERVAEEWFRRANTAIQKEWGIR